MSMRRGPLSTPSTAARQAFTLIELLVVIAIIMMLAALALPVLMRAARHARAVRCVANLKQLSIALRNYANAHEGVLPATQGSCQPDRQPDWIYHKDPDYDSNVATVWPDCPKKGTLFPYYRDPELVHCPADNDGNGKFSYSIPQNTAFHVMDNVVNSTEAILVIEEHPKYHIGGMYMGAPVGSGGLSRREGGFGCVDRPARRHSAKASFACFDGHAELYEFRPDFTASELWVDPWGHSCGWYKDDWDAGEYPKGRIPVGKTW